MNQKILTNFAKHIKENATGTNRGTIENIVQVSFQPPEVIQGVTQDITDENFNVIQKEMYSMEEDELALITKGLQAVLRGKLGSKNYDLKLKNVHEEAQAIEDDAVVEGEEGFYTLMSQSVRGSRQEFLEAVTKISHRMGKCYHLPMLFTFAQLSYSESENTTYFVVGMASPLALSKTEVVLENQDTEVRNHRSVIVKITTPEDGFMYPSHEDSVTPNVSRVVCYSKKKDKVNLNFVDKVLNAEPVLSAVEEKKYFDGIALEILGDKVRLEEITAIYEHLDDVLVSETFDGGDEYSGTLNKDDIDHLFRQIDENIEFDIDEVFIKVMEIEDYDFSVGNILPDKNKRSVLIENGDAHIYIEPNEMRKLKMVSGDNGEKYLMVRVDNGAYIGDFKLEESE